VPDLASLIESNVSTFLLQMGAAGGGTTREDDDVTWTIGGSPIGYHNAIVRFAATDEQRARTIVDEWDRELRDRALPGSCHLTPGMELTDVRRHLDDIGFVDGGHEPAMAVELTALGAPPSSDVEITEVRGADALTGYRDVLAAGFGEGPTEAGWASSTFAAIGFDADWRHYVAYDAGEAIGTASLLLTLPAGGIYFVCTHPDHRGRGVGAAITHHAMTEAAAAGAAYAVLGSSPMGHRVYERLGFRTVFTYRLLEREL